MEAIVGFFVLNTIQNLVLQWYYIDVNLQSFTSWNFLMSIFMSLLNILHSPVNPFLYLLYFQAFPKSKNELGHVWYCLWIWALSKKYTNDLLPEIYTTTLEWKHVVVTYSKEWKLQKHRSGKKSIYIFNKRSLQSLKKTPWPSHVQQCLPFEIAILTTHDP